MLVKFRLLFLLFSISIVTYSLSALSATNTDTLSPNIPYWLHLSSHSEALPLPTASQEQTATLILDIDQDGINDIVIGARKEPGPSLVWFRWETNAWVRYPIDNSALDIEAGGAYHDIDNDGDLDIVMGGDNNSNQVWWWENPAPNFNQNTPWTRRLIKNSGENIHHDQMFGDFDHDGQVELVFWNQANWNSNNNQARLYMAEIPTNPKTAVSWTFTSIYSDFGEGLAKGDIDLDGKIDLIAGGHWFKHQSGTTFSAHAIDDDYHDTRVAVGDLTGNGRLDVLLVRGDGTGPLRMYSCNNNPQQANCWQSTQLINSVDHGHSLDIQDINSDGAQDIFIAEMRLNDSNSDAQTTIFYGHGNGTFTQDTIATGMGMHEAKIGDLNGDSYLDIVAKPYNWDTPRLDLWFNAPRTHYASWERHFVDIEKPDRAVFVTSADLNGDTWPDIITGGWWYQNPGLAAGNWQRHTIGAPLNDMSAVLDIDGDGDMDILGSQGQGSKTSADFAWAQNNGSGNFTIRTNIATAPVKGFLQGVSVVDVDKNGRLDILLSWNNGNNGIQMLSIPANPTSTTWPMTAISNTSQGEQIDTADIDQDGDIDILLGTIWLQNNNNNWQSHTLFTPSEGEADRTQLADMDGDGDLDAVIGFGHATNTKLAWYEQPNDPTQTWTEHTIASLTSPLSLDVIDYESDGDLDVVVGEHDLDAPSESRLILYENIGGSGQAWQPHVLHVGDEHHDGTQFVDVDKDGDLDIISIGWTHGRVLLYENTFSNKAHFNPPALPNPLDFPEQLYLPLITR